MICLEDFWPVLMNSDLKNDEYWGKKIFDTNCKIHLAIMEEPYLSRILNGEKKIESRFSINRIKPYENISIGDIVILKKSSGMISAVFEAGEVYFKRIDGADDIAHIKEQYGDELCLEDDFWKRKINAKYVSLITISHLHILQPIQIAKKNRQSWLTYKKIESDNPSSTSNSCIVCIAGEIASGKTTVAKKLALSIEGEQFSVSDYLKHLLLEEGVTEPTRTQLQEMGKREIEKGWYSFVRGFLRFIDFDSGKTYIIDGIRHKCFMEAICSMVYPVTPLLIYLNVSEGELKKRRFSRQEGAYEASHIAEGDLCELRKISDFEIETSDKGVQDIVNEIIQQMGKASECKIVDKRVTVQYLKDILDDFNNERKWISYHNAMNLAMSICIEAAELLEMFQWMDKKGADQTARIYHREHMKDELADVLIYCIDLANAYGIDISSCIIEKLQKNERKYPVKTNGSSRIRKGLIRE